MEAQSEKIKIQALHLRTHQTNFCVELKYIEKSLLLTALEAIPGSPHFVAGLMNIRGTSVPVFDLTLRLGFTRRESYSLDTPILLCQVEGRLLGMIVDHIIGLIDIEKEKMQMHEQFHQTDSFILASVRIENELSMLIDMEQIAKFQLVDKRDAMQESVL